MAGLFDMLGGDEAAMQRQLDEQRAAKFAEQTQEQRLAGMGYKAGAGLGRGLAGAFGVDVQDPTIRRAAELRRLSAEYDTTTPEGLMEMAKALKSSDPQASMELAKLAQAAQLTAAQTGKAVAEQKKVELTTAQEEKLRKELTALGPDATEEQYLQVVRKYGDPDKIMTSIQTTQARQEAANAKIEAARIAAENRLEVARQQGATQMQIAQMQTDARRDIAALAASLKAGTQNTKPLSPGLQKEEGKDLEAIDSYTGQIQALTPAVTSLTPNAQGVRSLELGPLKNLKYEAQLAAGNSTPEARAYESLKSAVDTANNLQVSAEKGVQTDKDVLRFAKALIASYGRNDTVATYEALKRYQNALVQAQDRTKGRIESRRKAQGVGSFYEGSTQGPKPTVIKLD